ncbi:MAG: polyprenyl synthetase family protein [Pirellulaceae bacterium]
MSQVSENRITLALPRTLSLVSEPLQRVEQMLNVQLQSEVPIIDEMVRHGAVTGGKRFRPMLMLLTAQAYGDISEHHIMLATSVEMVHAASLVHDDIIDNATTRRHVATINSRWGNQGAVLFGDYLFTRAFYLSSLTGCVDACRILGDATNTVCEGELQQNDVAGNFDTTIDEYLDVISRKTAALCGCATRLGAWFSSRNDRESERWRRAGHNFGLAFQIVDDVLDYRGDANQCGKTLGTDLQTAKPTLPVLIGLQSLDDSARAEWIDALARHSASRSEVCDWLQSSGACQQSMDMAIALVEEALTLVAQQKNDAVAAAFAELGQFLLGRNH